MKKCSLLLPTIFLIIFNSVQVSCHIESLEVGTSSPGHYSIEFEGNSFSVDLRNATLSEVLTQISDQSGITFFLPSSVGKESISVRFNKFKIDDGLNKILAPYNRILIYSEEACASPEPPLTRLTEVRIYPSINEGNNKGAPEGSFTIHPSHRTATANFAKKESGEKMHGMNESHENSKTRTGATLSETLKNPGSVNEGAAKAFAGINAEKITRTSALAQENSNTGIRKEALGKEKENLNEKDADDSQTETEGEGPLPEGEGNPSFSIDYGNGSVVQENHNITDVNIRLNDVPDKLISAGFVITYDPSKVTIMGTDIYDGSTLPGLWDHEMTKTFQDADGPGTYMVACGNLSCVMPDGNGTVNIAKVRFRCKDHCETPITISTVSGFDTVVGGKDGFVYDSSIKPLSITIH